ncbi:MAG: Ig-like domain-containing protein [Lachnospira sp.]|nr:Ig-like domain-containing protein [Lachnospira sp.]
MAKKNKIKNWVIPGVVGGVVIILTVASIVSGSIQQKKEKESNAASVSVDRIKLKDDSAQAQQMSNTETEVEIEFEDCAVPVGTQLKMTALVVPENTDQALIWSSSDSSVAEIDKDGILTVKAVGTTVVTATVGTVSDSVVIEGIENVAQGSKNNLPVYTGTTLAKNSASGSGSASGSTSSGGTSAGSGSDSGSTGTGVGQAGGSWTGSGSSGSGSYDGGSGDSDSDGGDDSGSTDSGSGSSGGSSNSGSGTTGGSSGSNSGNNDGSSTNGGNSSNNSNSGSNTGNGDNSGSISDGLSGIGFTQRYSNVYVCEENDTYYGEIITQPNVTIIYIKQRSGTFDSRIQTVLARLLPDEYGQVWSNYLSANTDRTFTAEGRRVRIVVAPNGGHSQIVIYN